MRFAAAAQVAAEVPQLPPMASAIGGRRILVVDDEVRLTRLIREALAPDHVTVAASGREALACISEGPPFDAIVCDLMMPDLTGMDVYERVRVQTPGLERKMVFMTGGAFTPRALLFLAESGNVCLDKPFLVAGLLDAIDRITRTP